MNLQARKLNLIQEFLRINSEELVDKLDNFLHAEKSKIYEQELKPMSMESFDAAIDQSEDDSENDRVIEANKLKKEIEGWG